MYKKIVHFFKNFSISFFSNKKQEHRIFLLSGGLSLMIMVSFCILRNLKDSLIQSHLGTESIPYMKTFVMLPVSFLVTIIVIKLFNIFNRRQIFNLIAYLFISFLLIFSLWIYPNIEEFCISETYMDSMAKKYQNLHYFLRLIKYWPITLFYIVCELWSILLGNTLFWQLIHDITTVKNSKKVYSTYAIFGHVGALLGAAIIKVVKATYSSFDNKASTYVLILIMTVVLFGITMIMLFNKIDDMAKRHLSYNNQKEELSLYQSIKYIIKSKYLFFIFLIILSFGVQNNLFDLLMKKQVEMFYLSDTVEISDYHAMFYGAVAITTIVITIFFRFIINKFGWFTSAIAPPMILLFIFTPYCLKVFGIDIINYDIMYPALAILLILSIQQLLNRAIKYGVMEPTKEMLYLPLERGLRSKGKAAVEILAPNIAKSIGGAFIIIMLTFSEMSNIESLQEECVVICGICLIIWIYSICRINTMYQEKLAKEN